MALSFGLLGAAIVLAPKSDGAAEPITESAEAAEDLCGALLANDNLDTLFGCEVDGRNKMINVNMTLNAVVR